MSCHPILSVSDSSSLPSGRRISPILLSCGRIDHCLPSIQHARRRLHGPRVRRALDQARARLHEVLTLEGQQLADASPNDAGAAPRHREAHWQRCEEWCSLRVGCYEGCCSPCRDCERYSQSHASSGLHGFCINVEAVTHSLEPTDVSQSTLAALVLSLWARLSV